MAKFYSVHLTVLVVAVAVGQVTGYGYTDCGLGVECPDHGCTIAGGVLDCSSASSDRIILEIKDRRVERLPRGVFGNLSNLQVLDLSNNSIARLEDGLFVGPTNLLQLNLRDNRIQTVPSGYFRDLTGLTRLNLGGNHFVNNLERGSFAGLTNLYYLHLQDCNITKLPRRVFNGMTKLVYLELNFNQITSLPNGVFKSLNNLTRLDIVKNNISKLSIQSFKGLTSLSTLDLHSNRIETLPKGLFVGSPNLQKLDLSVNSISSLSSGVFNGLTKLTYLLLNTNTIKTLASDVFHPLTNLNMLRLSGNQISILPSGVFGRLTKLAELNLHINHISNVPSGVFDNLTELTTLSLNYNNISSFPFGIFKNLNKISTIWIGGEHQMTLDKRLCGLYTKLNVLNETYQDQLPNIRRYIRDNGIVGCFSDCSAVSISSLGCHATSRCHGTIADHTCICATGVKESESQGTCTDVCKTMPAGPTNSDVDGFSYANGTGTATFSCRLGYSLEDAQRNTMRCRATIGWAVPSGCIDVDECLNKDDRGCSACSNTPGSYSCSSCLQDYSLHSGTCFPKSPSVVTPDVGGDNSDAVLVWLLPTTSGHYLNTTYKKARKECCRAHGGDGFRNNGEWECLQGHSARVFDYNLFFDERPLLVPLSTGQVALRNSVRALLEKVSESLGGRSFTIWTNNCKGNQCRTYQYGKHQPFLGEMEHPFEKMRNNHLVMCTANYSY